MIILNIIMWLFLIEVFILSQLIIIWGIKEIIEEIRGKL